MKFGWCVSGQGMAMRAVVAAQKSGLIKTRVVFVVTDRPSPIEAFCDDHDIARVRADPVQLSPILIDGKAQHALDWLGLTFNRLLKPEVIASYEQRILNMHFSLLPDFAGFNPTARALENGAKTTGVSLHLIDAGIDTGPIVAQARCVVEHDDTVAVLGRRQFECAVPLVLQAIRRIERGDLRVIAGRPVWRLPTAPRDTPIDAIPIDKDIVAFAAEFSAGLVPR